MNLSWTYKLSSLLGPRLAISTILLGDHESGWVAHFGLKCSSFTTMNCGTSGRSPCTPCGNLGFTSVQEGNTLASRFLGLQQKHAKAESVRIKSVASIVDLSDFGFVHDGSMIPSKYLSLWKPRVMLLMALVVCLNGTIILEQPANSLLEYYPRFRQFLDMLNKIGGRFCVPC